MNLEQQLKLLPDNVDICLGAFASYLYIAPKPELMEWLKDNMQYMDREVRKCEFCEDVHHGYIVLIEGNERGDYAFRSEVEKKPLPLPAINNEEGCKNLVTAILADMINDIAKDKAFRQYYGSENLTEKGADKLKLLSETAKKASNFFADKEATSRWIEADGQWMKHLADDKAILIIEDKNTRLAVKAFPQRFKKMFEPDKLRQIARMIVRGASAEDVLMTCEKKAITAEDIEEIRGLYDSAREAERNKYQKSNLVICQE